MPPTPKRILQREQMLVRVTVEHPECTAACSVQPTFLSPWVPVSLVCPPPMASLLPVILVTVLPSQDNQLGVG